MARIGVIGWGIVGQATGEGFSKAHQVVWYDKYKKSPIALEKLAKESEYIFLCVPTPMLSNGKAIDLSIINEVVKKIAPYLENTNKALIIKSSVIPETTANLARKFKKVNFAMSPEFLTELNAFQDFLNPDRIIIGVFDESIGIRIALLHKQALGNNIKIFITDPTTAEMVKYMANTFLATKIIFANEMFELSEKLGVNYDSVREMVSADKRISPSFLKVTPFRGFGQKCFPKDTVALLGLAKELGVDLSVLKAAWKKNLKIRKIKDWNNIDGAVSKRH